MVSRGWGVRTKQPSKMRSAGRRHRPKDSLMHDRAPPPPTPTADPWQFVAGRDSDASLCSSRPSSVGANRSAAVTVTDRGYQNSAIRIVNSYLASHSSQIFLKPPLPSAKDIIETLKFVLARLEFPTNKPEEDLPVVLKQFHCPIKLNKSALKAPGTPHSWPSLLAVIHWLVQIAMYNEHMGEQSIFQDNSMLTYAMNSYLHFIRGEDDSVDMLDRESLETLQKVKDSGEEKVKTIEVNVRDLESKLESLRAQPSAKEVLEKERSILEEDVKKFQLMIEQLNGHILSIQKVLEEKEKELEVKVGETKRICEENEELKKRVDEQRINSRDAERMKRELQTVERDIEEAEMARKAWEEKSWDLDYDIGRKFKELMTLSIDCNQAIKRLKLGSGFQFELNAKGSTPYELLGIDYKSTLKPALSSFADDMEKSLMDKLEELIHLQQKSVENAKKIEAKRNHLMQLQARIDEGEAQMNLKKQEIHEYTLRCAAEAKKMTDDVKSDAQKLDMVEREAAEFHKTSKLRLQEATKADEDETQNCARELLVLVDSVSKYKEYMTSKISEMRSFLTESVVLASDLYKSSMN